MYQFDDSYDPYPKPINLIIEKAYQSQVPFAEWDEEDGLYRLDFQRMEETKNKDGKSVVKVKRMTAGWCFQCFDTAWWGSFIRDDGLVLSRSFIHDGIFLCIRHSSAFSSVSSYLRFSSFFYLSEIVILCLVWSFIQDGGFMLLAFDITWRGCCCGVCDLERFLEGVA